jgi:hypothetical protein
MLGQASPTAMAGANTVDLGATSSCYRPPQDRPGTGCALSNVR